MYEAPKNLWIEWMTEISEILRWTNVNTFVRQLTCLEVKTRTKPWWLLRNHWHQKVHTVGEFSKDAPAYLSVWISKFPRRSIKLQQLPTSTRNSRKMKKKKKEVVPFSPWRLPVVQTHPDSFPTSYDQRLPGAHQRYTSHRQRVVWNNAVDAAGSVPPSSLGLHRISSPMFKLLPSNLKTALQDVERFKPNRVTCWRGSDGCCHALCHSAHACCRQRCPNGDSWWLSRDAKRHWHFQDDVNQSLYGQSQVACLIQSGINTSCSMKYVCPSLRTKKTSSAFKCFFWSFNRQTNLIYCAQWCSLTILGPTQKPQFQAAYDARLSNSFMLKNLGVFNLGTIWPSNTAGKIIQVREVVEWRIFADAYVVSSRTDSTKIVWCPQKNDRNLRSPVPKIFTHNFIWVRFILQWL